MKRARSHRSWSSITARRIGIAAVGIGILPLAGCGSLSDKNMVTVAGHQMTVEQFEDIRSALEKNGATDLFLLPANPNAPADSAVSKKQLLLQSITTSLLTVAVAEKLGVNVPSEPDANGKRAIEAEASEQPMTGDENSKTYGDVAKALDRGARQLFWDFLTGRVFISSQQASPFAGANEESFESLAASAPDLANETCFDAVVVPVEARAATQKLVDAKKTSSVDGFRGNQCTPNVALATFPPAVADVLRTERIGATSKAIVLKPTEAEKQQGAKAQVAWVRPLGPKKLSERDAAAFLKTASESPVVSFVSLFAFSKGWVKLNPEYGVISMDLNGQLAITAGPPETHSEP